MGATWHRVLDLDEPPEGRVKTVSAGWRKISKEQRAGDWEVWQTSLHNPSFAQYAEISGAQGIRVTEPGQLDAAIGRALGHSGPSLVEVVSDPDLV